MNKIIYLDHNATTPLHPEVKVAIQSVLDKYGNPSSMHTIGREAKALVAQTRTKIADFINAKAEEIIFTGSGTEADNTVLNLAFHPDLAGKQIIVSSIEHPAILDTAKYLQTKGVNVKFVEVDNHGKIKIDHLQKLLQTKTSLVSILMVNNEIGTIQDIKQLATLSHQYGALFHTDAVQAIGKIPINVVKLNIDYLTMSAHKIYGPKGIGALYVNKKAPYIPYLIGGHQENGKRASTENTLGIIGFGKAIEMRIQEMEVEHKKIAKLKELLKQGIKKNIPNISFNGDKNGVANTLNVSFAGAEGESILLYLDHENIAVSTGSACASGSLEPSHVLLALGLPIEYTHGSIRMSMGRETTEQDINYVLEVLPRVIEKIRGMSTVNPPAPFGKGG